MRSLAVLVAGVALSAAAACSTGEAASPELERPAPPLRPELPPLARDPAARPRNVAELFEAKILPTCSVNGGVCHNSNTSPDLRNLAALRDLVDLPCGRDAGPEAPFPDACEPPGDRLVAAGLDLEVLRVAADGDGVRIEVDGDVPGGALGPVTIRRGALVFDAGAQRVSITRDGPRAFRANLATASPEGRTFFQPQLPLREDRIWPADVNGNGVAGAPQGWREIVPGRPDRSYLVARLWDDAINPELMPRQCRTWDDDATRALACWIEGLRRDEQGALTNFTGDIDYATCSFEPPRGGRCGSAAR
ncbi:MAG TPA: hypothetical protein VLT33_46450 [Labilithrix sp.]|nr:hypothetical protein [Labilithrix sp.]